MLFRFVTACYNCATNCYNVRDSMPCWSCVSPYWFNTWHTVAFVRHTYYCGHFHNMLCRFVTVCYNCATYCYNSRDSMPCWSGVSPHCWKSWHIIKLVGLTYYCDNFHNMLCRYVTVCYNCATYCYNIGDSMLVHRASRHTGKKSDTLFQVYATHIIVATFTICCVDL
jgi:hypothetical protein